MRDMTESLLHKKAIRLDTKVRYRTAIRLDMRDLIRRTDPSCDRKAVHCIAATGWNAANCRIRRRTVTRSTIARNCRDCSG
jgi:hypothetical protein